MDLTEAEDIKKRWLEYTELYKEDLNDPDNHNSVITQRNIWKKKERFTYLEELKMRFKS